MPAPPVNITDQLHHEAALADEHANLERLVVLRDATDAYEIARGHGPPFGPPPARPGA